jgi:hypothetical protein
MMQCFRNELARVRCLTPNQQLEQLKKYVPKLSVLLYEELGTAYDDQLLASNQHVRLQANLKTARIVGQIEMALTLARLEE